MHILSRIFIRDGRLHPGWRVGLYLLAYLVGTFVLSMFVGIVYVIALQVLGDTAQVNALMRGAMPPGLLLVLELAMLIVVVPLTWLFRHFLDGQSWVSLGWRRQGGWWLADIGLGLALGFVLMAAIFAVEVGAGWLHVAGMAWATRGVAAVAGVVLIYLANYVMVGINEELIFRGYVFVNLREINTILAVIVSSVMFGLAHILNPSFGPIALFNIALVGVFFCYAYLATGNLWLPIAYHFSWNFCQGTVFSFPVSGTGGEGLFVTALTGAPDWITGGNFGPEAGLLGTIAILAGFPVVWAWARLRPVSPLPARERGRGYSPAEPG